MRNGASLTLALECWAGFFAEMRLKVRILWEDWESVNWIWILEIC